jgi:hypothetical protein
MVSPKLQPRCSQGDSPRYPFPDNSVNITIISTRQSSSYNFQFWVAPWRHHQQAGSCLAEPISDSWEELLPLEWLCNFIEWNSFCYSIEIYGLLLRFIELNYLLLWRGRQLFSRSEWAEAVTFLTFIRKIPDSERGRNTEYRRQGYSRFSSAPTGKILGLFLKWRHDSPSSYPINYVLSCHYLAPKNHQVPTVSTLYGVIT